MVAKYTRKCLVENCFLLCHWLPGGFPFAHSKKKRFEQNDDSTIMAADGMNVAGKEHAENEEAAEHNEKFYAGSSLLFWVHVQVFIGDLYRMQRKNGI